MRVSGVRARVLLCLLLLLGPILTMFDFSDVSAAQITSRSLTLEANSTALTAKLPTASAPSVAGHADSTGLANHHFKFTVPTTAGIRSIGIQYCTTADGTCTAPTDLKANNGGSTTLGTTVGLTGAALTQSSANADYVSVTADPSSTIEVTINGVYNPSATNTTFFGRITTYTSSNASTGATDTGTTAASTSTAIVVSGTMPEYLAFCTGAQITLVGGGGTIPDCTTATAGSIQFNQDFSPSDTATATSQMAAATNAISGYVISVAGTTLTSGSNTIPAVGSTATSVAGNRGTSSFGINLVTNTTAASSPAVGGAIAPASSGATLQANPTTNFATADSFALDLTGATAIAKSDAQTPGTSKPTNMQRYIVSYFADVSGIQPPGTYVATLNYVCTPTY